MHQVYLVSVADSLNELNQVLAQEPLWISQVVAGTNNQYLVVLTDSNPDVLPWEELDEYDDEEYE